jgi:hypothetical protein
VVDRFPAAADPGEIHAVRTLATWIDVREVRTARTDPRLPGRRGRYDGVILASVKTAISLPDDVFVQLEAAAHKAGLSRSQFFRTAGLRYAADLASADLTWSVDAYVDATGDDGADPHWTAAARRSLARADPGDEW